MATVTTPVQLTGSNSIYPYGVDTFSFMHNYQSWEEGEQGDVIAAAFRNRIADSIIRIEQDLVGVVKSDTGDMRIAACTMPVTGVVVNTNYYVTIPSDVVSYISYDGSGLNNKDVPITYLFGARPANATKMALWSGLTDPRASYQYFIHMLGNTNQICFQFWDASGKVAASPSYGGSLGDYIISAVFMRAK